MFIAARCQGHLGNAEYQAICNHFSNASPFIFDASKCDSIASDVRGERYSCAGGVTMAELRATSTSNSQSETTTPTHHPRRTGYANLRDQPIAEDPTTPTAPRPPVGRSYSSTYNSPSIGFRPDDETFVFEFSSRYLKAGIAGANSPRCILDFSPSRRLKLGDYGQWLPGAKATAIPEANTLDDWGNDYVLWNMDVRKTNLGLLGDLIERTVREAISKYLLILDGKRRKITLAVPPALPDPMLETVLLTLFETHPAPTTITLLPCPVLCVVGAGLRSALVVDIGWDETVVSVIYEFRQVLSRTTTRSMKGLSWAVKELLEEKFHEAEFGAESGTTITFEEVDEVMTRMAWCRNNKDDLRFAGKLIELPVSGTDTKVEFTRFSDAVEHVFLNSEEQRTDEDDRPLPLFMFQALLALPIDMRQTCLSRIIITGAGGDIPGFRGRLLSELAKIVSTRKWDPVHSYSGANLATNGLRRGAVNRLKKLDVVVETDTGSKRTIAVSPTKPAVHDRGAHNPTLHGPDVSKCKLCREVETAVQELTLHKHLEHTNKDVDIGSTTPIGLQPPLPDVPILNAMRSRTDIAAAASTKLPETIFTPSHERVRGVITAGAWVGASLLAGLHIAGAVEIERERFLRDGLEGCEAHMQEEKEREAENARAGVGRSKRTVSGLRSFASVTGRDIG